MELIAVGVLVLAFVILLVYHLRRKAEVKREWEESTKYGSGPYRGTGGKGGPDTRLDR